MSFPTGNDAAGSSDDHRDKRSLIAFTNVTDYARDTIDRAGLDSEEWNHGDVVILEDIMENMSMLTTFSVSGNVQFGVVDDY